jgi:hypothetical protein
MESIPDEMLMEAEIEKAHVSRMIGLQAEPQVKRKRKQKDRERISPVLSHGAVLLIFQENVGSSFIETAFDRGR